MQVLSFSSWFWPVALGSQNSAIRNMGVYKHGCMDGFIRGYTGYTELARQSTSRKAQYVTETMSLEWPVTRVAFVEGSTCLEGITGMALVTCGACCCRYDADAVPVGPAAELPPGHVTNAAQNENSGVWSLAQLRVHLGGTVYQRLWDAMATSTAHVFASAIPRVHEVCCAHAFRLAMCTGPCPPHC
jgi:hypothetical protein